MGTGTIVPRPHPGRLPMRVVIAFLILATVWVWMYLLMTWVSDAMCHWLGPPGCA